MKFRVLTLYPLHDVLTIKYIYTPCMCDTSNCILYTYIHCTCTCTCMHIHTNTNRFKNVPFYMYVHVTTCILIMMTNLQLLKLIPDTISFTNDLLQLHMTYINWSWISWPSGTCTCIRYTILTGLHLGGWGEIKGNPLKIVLPLIMNS